MREKAIARQYSIELFGSVFIYAAILVAAMKFGPPMQPGAGRLLVLVSPMIGFGLMGWALVRQYCRVDEFIRRLLLENAVIAAGITAGLTFTYGFLENAGYPRLSMFVVWPVMGAAWGLVAMIRSASNR
jgi:hypothetical protein